MSDKFIDLLPEDVQNGPDREFLSRYAGPADAAKALVEQNRVISKDSIRIPGEAASDADKQKFRDNVMKFLPDLKPPAEAKDYPSKIDWKDGENELSYGGERLEKFRDLAHGNGLTLSQFEAMGKYLHSMETEKAAAAKATRDEWRELALQEGTNFTEYKNRVAKTFIDHGFGAGLVEKVQDETLDVQMVRLADKLAVLSKDGGTPSGVSGRTADPSAGSMEENRTRINEILATQNWVADEKLVAELALRNGRIAENEGRF